MTYKVTKTFLHSLNEILIANPMKEAIQVRDFSQIHMDDQTVRTKQNYVATDKLTVNDVQDDLIEFSVSQPFYLTNRVLKPCFCRWKSAHCVYEFHYDVFKCSDGGKHFVYLDLSLYMQLCRRHKKVATDIQIIQSGKRKSLYDSLAEIFIFKVLSKIVPAS